MGDLGRDEFRNRNCSEIHHVPLISLRRRWRGQWTVEGSGGGAGGVVLGPCGEDTRFARATGIAGLGFARFAPEEFDWLPALAASGAGSLISWRRPVTVAVPTSTKRRFSSLTCWARTMCGVMANTISRCWRSLSSWAKRYLRIGIFERY